MYRSLTVHCVTLMLHFITNFNDDDDDDDHEHDHDDHDDDHDDDTLFDVCYESSACTVKMNKKLS